MHIRAATGVDKFQKSKSKTREKVKHDAPIDESHQRVFFNEFNEEDEKLQKRAVMDAFIAKLFAAISSVKAAYAELQYFQLPYDPDGIQSADQTLVSELKSLSELKQSFLKKHLDDFSPETTKLSAEVQEQKNLIKTYEITRKKLISQSKLKDSEIIFLKEKLEEIRRENKIIEKRLNSSALYHHLHLMQLLIRFNRMLFTGIRLIYAMHSSRLFVNKCSMVLIFENSRYPDSQSEKTREFFFDKFMELKSLKAREYITWKPTSVFAEFCRCKYLKLIHPKMEASLFGNLNQRNLVNARKFPETAFFDSFLEVAKWVWLLHCLAFSFSPDGATVFQVPKGSRFSEVFMDSVNEVAYVSPNVRRRWLSRWFQGLSGGDHRRATCFTW
ncbi:putative protein gravitropic in the light 1 [Helianthus annuus]|nr:putative protein gravitropic in the light 1 [Helianthus annuus]